MNENGMQLLMVNNLMRYANAVIDWYDEMEFNGPLLTDLYYKEFLTFELGAWNVCFFAVVNELLGISKTLQNC